MMTPDELWAKHAAKVPGVLARRPDFRFDPAYYGRRIGQPDQPPERLLEHYRQIGATQGLHRTHYAEWSTKVSDIARTVQALVIDPELLQLIESGAPDATQLACELINLGAPVDAAISHFSLDYYRRTAPDVDQAKINPLLHFLRSGAREGRKSLADLRKSHFRGKSPYIPDRPTCLIVVHECSRTGAPIVGLDLVREAAQTHNVVVAAFRGGELLDDFCALACEVVVTNDPVFSFSYFSGEIFDRIEYAITNSVECFLFVPLLVAREIPFAAYVHEYADYTFPTYKSTLTALFADMLIFSSEHVRDSWAGRLKDIEFNVARDTAIFAQRNFAIGGVGADTMAGARARLSTLIGRDLSGVRLICGAGQLHWRKGTDIFAMTAQICTDPDTVFLWIGDGLNAEDMQFGVWMDYHLRQIAVGMPSSNLFFLPAGPAYRDVMAASDAMFVSSRLDPLPNVVFDALDAGCRIVLFDKASGFGDPLYRASDHFVTVEYANPAAAARAIECLPRKVPAAKTTAGPRPLLFASIRRALKTRLEAQRYFVRGTPQIDVPILDTGKESDRDLRRRAREKALRYRRRFVWRDLAEVEEALSTSDSWVHRTMRLAPYGVTQTRTETETETEVGIGIGALPDFSMHIHAYYTDDLSKDVQSYCAYHHAKRIVVTTDTARKADDIRAIMGAAGLTPEVKLIANRGRDILPFMELFHADAEAGDDEVWCHLHQKKSLGTGANGDVWRQFLMRILLGDETSLSSAIAAIGHEGVGLVAPFDPFHVPWNASRKVLPRFASRLPGPMPGNPLLFPCGNMFWVRRPVVLAMNDVFGDSYPWPNEPIANDGTEFHLIERLWPAMATSLGLESVFVHKLDQRRM